MEALAGAHDEAVQMIGTSFVRVHQYAACIARYKKHPAEKKSDAGALLQPGLTRACNLVERSLNKSSTVGVWQPADDKLADNCSPAIRSCC